MAKQPGLGVQIPVFLLQGNLQEGWIHIKAGHGSEDWDLVWATLEAGESDQYPTENMMIMDVIGKTLLKPDLVYRKDNEDSTVYESKFSYYDHRIEVKKTGNVCVIVGSRGQVVSAYFKDAWRKEC